MLCACLLAFEHVCMVDEVVFLNQCILMCIFVLGLPRWRQQSPWTAWAHRWTSRSFFLKKIISVPLKTRGSAGSSWNFVLVSQESVLPCTRMQNDSPLISNPSLKNAVMCSFLRKHMCPVFNYTNAISLCLDQHILEQNFSLFILNYT